jgi:hypothetical protein
MNPYLKQRLDGLLQHFRAGHLSGSESATANRGTEREAFLLAFLSQVLPPIYRAGCGEITDVEQNRSGQLDIVIEMPWAPSFGFPGSPVRLYPAEAVGVVIEVKSNVKAQWGEVQNTAAALAKLRQRLSGTSVRGGQLEIHRKSVERIPVFAVGYKGWTTSGPIEKKLINSELDGILVLDGPLFVESDRLPTYQRMEMAEREDDFHHRALRRVLEMSRLGDNVEAIAARLNEEGLSSARSNYGDERFLPQVVPKSWTEPDVEACIDVLSRRTKSYAGTEALFAFVRRVHEELSKRSAMSVELDMYGSLRQVILGESVAVDATA